ncbi:MAG: sigma 54-interacting transcriptional regulator [Bacteroidota bacterium]
MMTSYAPRDAWSLSLGIVLAWSVLSVLLFRFFQPLEDHVLDAKFLVRGERPIDSSVVVIYLDNEQVNALGGWPIRRSYYALMISVLSDLDASVIGTDIFFQSKVLEYPDYDDLLVNIVRDAGNVVLAGYFKNVEEKNGQFHGTEFREPYKELLDATLNIGHANIPDELSVRHIATMISSDDRSIPAFPIAIAMAHVAKKHPYFEIAPKPSLSSFPLDYTGGTEHLEAYPFVEFLRSYDIFKQGGTPPIPVQTVKEKIALIAATGEGRARFVSTPFTDRYPSVGVHATVIDNFLRQSYLHVATPFADSLWSLFVGGVVLLLFRLYRERRAFMWAGIVGILVMVVSFGLFAVFTYSIAVIQPLFVLTGASFTLLILQHSRTQRRLERVTQDKQKIELDLKAKEARLRGLEKELSSAKQEASQEREQKLVAELNRYRQDIRNLTTQAADLEEFDATPEVTERREFEGIVYGTGSKMEPVVEMVKKISSADAPVLILGESGTGKELVAHAVHHLSRRQGRPFVAVNCGALTETLLESELFGHEKGAFTGAVKEKPGRFELAEEGTIFLDEISETSEAFQVKLLRVLQQGEFERVGGTRTLRVDVRVLAATNRDPMELIEANKFREDLFYRVNVFTLNLPPLRERRGDLPFLVRSFLAREGSSFRISAHVMDAFLNHEWRGNVRELESVIKRAAVLAKAENRHLIRTEDLPEEVAAAAKENADIEDQILQTLRNKQFSRNAISETADELGGFNRGTIAEYFRGICFETFVERSWDLSTAVQVVSSSENPTVNRRVRKKMVEYLGNVVEAIDRSKTLEEVRNAITPKYKNLPQRYHLYLTEIVDTYHRGDWKLA